MEHIAAIISIIISYYAISGMSTTNIMRLLKDETARQNDIHCFCGNCGHIIPLYHQFPIFSYFASKKKCRYCGVSIPPLTTILEIVVFSIMTLISAIFSFKPIGVIFSFTAYELLRIILIFKFGKRTNNFIKEYVIAVLYILVTFLLVLFMSYLSTLSDI